MSGVWFRFCKFPVTANDSKAPPKSPYTPRLVRHRVLAGSVRSVYRLPRIVAVTEYGQAVCLHGRRGAVEALSAMTYVMPDAAALEGLWVAADGTPVTIRGIRPGDAAREACFVRELSARSRRLRFMDALRELTPRQVEHFTQPDPRRELALVALVRGVAGGADLGAEPGDGEGIVAVARYVVGASGQDCEFAIVVADAWQRRGLGRQLLGRLVELARGSGLARIRGTVLAENVAMLGLARRLGFRVTPLVGESGLREVELLL